MKWLSTCAGCSPPFPPLPCSSSLHWSGGTRIKLPIELFLYLHCNGIWRANTHTQHAHPVEPIPIHLHSSIIELGLETMQTRRRCLFIVANRPLWLCCSAAVCTPRRAPRNRRSGGVIVAAAALPLNVDVDVVVD